MLFLVFDLLNLFFFLRGLHFIIIGFIGAALAKVTIHKMGNTESSAAIIFYFGLVSAVISGPLERSVLTFTPRLFMALRWD